MTKYNTESQSKDGKTELDPEDDAAYVNWGSLWRMPTKAQMDELREKCTWMWTTMNGVKGYQVTGPNNNTLFLPATGHYLGETLYEAGSNGNYWSRTLYSFYSYYANYLTFDYDSKGVVTAFFRISGYSVRAIRISYSHPLYLPYLDY